MRKTIRFRNKLTSFFSFITLFIVAMLFSLLMVFFYNMLALIIGVILLLLIAYFLFILSRRKIIIEKNTLTIVEFATNKIYSKDIKSIICNRSRNGIIFIKTVDKDYYSGGYLMGRHSFNVDKNEKLVEELNSWLQEYK